MKKIVYMLMAVAAVVSISCSSDDPWSDYEEWANGQGNNMEGGSIGGGASTGTALTSELGTFDISINTDPLSETETLPGSNDTYYEDYVETFSPVATIKIAFSGSDASVSGSADGVTVSKSGAHVTVKSEAKNITYELSGTTTDGSFKIYSDKKFKLTLNGVNITNPSGAAINNQGKRAYVVVSDGTENTLTDGTSYTMVDGEDQKAAFFSEGKLDFSGAGRLSVYAKGKNGIVSDDYVYIRPNTNIYVNSTASNGIKTNDGVIIKGGVVNVEVSAAASKGIKTDGFVQIDGGRITLITTGGTEYDSDDKEYKGCAALKADSIIVINNGELLVKSTGGGGKGISGDQTFTVNGGSIKAIASGSNSNSVSAKAIKTDGDITIAGGSIMARAAAHEAMESKGKMTISAGTVAAYSSDDAINSAKDMVINGGYVFCYSTGNDGIDSNGNLTINGGVVIGCGTSSPEEGIDAAEGKTLSFNGGTIIGIGGGAEATSGSQQKATLTGVTVSSGAYLTVQDASGNNIFAFKSPRTYSNATLQVSSPKFTSGTTYTLSTATSASGNDEFYGFISGATVSGESKLGTFTTSTTTSGGMGGGAMGGGGFSGGNGSGGGMPGRW